MDRLWAPWRTEYVQGIDTVDDECVFCKSPAAARDCDKDNLILFRGKLNVVMLNKYPYTNGHIMVIPCKHTSSLSALDDATMLEMWQLVHRSAATLHAAMRADGFNIGMNVGRVAGAGIDHHLHMHVVPRWNGDNNFMSVIGDAKVISQGLDKTYELLAPYFTGANS